MDTQYWTKTVLYNNIDSLKRRFNIPLYRLPVDSKMFGATYIKNLIVEEFPFSSNKICGILYKGSRTSSIALNSNRSPEMQNFDCMHELIHYFFHDAPDRQYLCVDSGQTNWRVKQNLYIEWQANEGAAQFLVPYQDFIPRFLNYMDSYPCSLLSIQERLASHYFVSTQVINIRISNLSYEIDQYRKGVEIGKIRLLSRIQQQRQGIRPTCYNSLRDSSFDWNAVI